MNNKQKFTALDMLERSDIPPEVHQLTSQALFDENCSGTVYVSLSTYVCVCTFVYVVCVRNQHALYYQLSSPISPPKNTHTTIYTITQTPTGPVICLLAALPHIIDSGKAGRDGYLDTLLDVAKKHRKAPIR